MREVEPPRPEVRLSRVSLEPAGLAVDLDRATDFLLAEEEVVQIKRATAASWGPAEPEALEEEVVGRTAALAAGCRRRTPSGALLPRPLLLVLDSCEARARRLEASGHGLSPAAAVEFLGDVVAELAIGGSWASGNARDAIARTAAALGFSEDATLLATFRRAVACTECAKLPPAAAIDLILTLLVELGPAQAASLWGLEPSGRTRCLAAAGKTPRSRCLREAARATLDGVLADSPHVQTTVVERWDRPYGALVARVAGCDAARLAAYLADATSALAPVLEREALFVRNVERERQLVAAGERRLIRLGFDLHDGPLQELVALAEDVRFARSQMATLIDDSDQQRVGGRFADLEARLESLDRGLREIARSVRSTTALEGPLGDALRAELDALGRTSDIATSFSLEGDLGDLTDSQKIVVFRVVQESLANVRKHSAASTASVSVCSTRRFVDVIVADNGRGFDRDRVTVGRLGLAGVSERARLLGGAVEIAGRVGIGTEVRVTLPRWQPSPTESTTPLYVAAF